MADGWVGGWVCIHRILDIKICASKSQPIHVKANKPTLQRALVHLVHQDVGDRQQGRVACQPTQQDACRGCVRRGGGVCVCGVSGEWRPQERWRLFSD